MIRIFLPLICAALGFAAASCSQSEGTLAPADPPANPHPVAHGAASAAVASAPAAPSPDPQPASSASAAPAPDASSAPADAPATDAPAADSATADAPATDAPAADAPATDAPAVDAPAEMAVERRASTLIGMPVVSTQGDPLGEVKDIIFDRQGRATHVVVSYDTATESPPADVPGDGKPAAGAEGKLTAIPWDAAVASIKDGRLVLESAKLQSAPSFTQDAWPNLENPAWSATTDTYWRKAVKAAIAAHPGNPIDSTTRQRGRPTRDGNNDGDGN